MLGSALLLRVVRWVGFALALGLCAVLLLLVDPTGRVLGRVVGIGGTALFIVSIGMMVLTFRSAKRLSPIALAVGAITSVVTTLVFHMWAGGQSTASDLALAALAGGLLGGGWSMTGLLFVEPGAAGEVRARGDLWFLAAWAVTLLLPQLVALAGQRTPATLTLLSFLGMGIAIGNSGGLMLRAWAARRRNSHKSFRRA